MNFSTNEMRNSLSVMIFGSEVGDDEEWHAHKVTLDGDNCVTSLDEDGNASLDGNTVTVEDTDADSIDNVLTAVLSAEKKGGVCVAKVFSQV